MLENRQNVVFEISTGWSSGAEFDLDDFSDAEFGALVRAFVYSAVRKDKDVRIEIVSPKLDPETDVDEGDS